jgi:glycosyltransferase involved in cell wall biosynthesis
MGEELGITMGLNPNSRFMTIGGNYTHGLPIDRVRALGWIGTTRKIYKQIAKFDIGIAPLTPHVFNESKSYIKALEYAALGIPCVASKVGPYPDFIEHGVTGFLVEKPGDWNKYVGELVRDEDLRAGMGRAARYKAQDFTIQGNSWRWANALRG